MRRSELKRTAWRRADAPKPPPRDERQVVAAKPLARRATYVPVDGGVNAAPKSLQHRCPALLELARGKPCLLRIAGVCCGDPSTTVACHSNWSDHGKAGSRKADDQYTVWGCVTCHSWLDQGSAPQAEKRSAFDVGLHRQLAEWASIQATDRGRHGRAANWALERIAEQKSKTT